MKTSWLWNSLFVLTLAGCDEPEEVFGDDVGDDEVSERCVYCNGIKLNTNKSGVWAWSAASNQFGKWQDGVVLDSVTSPQYGPISKVWVDGGRLYGTIGGQTHNEKVFLNSQWKLRVDTQTSTGIIDMTMTLIKFGQAAGNRVYTFSHVYTGGGDKPIMNCDKDPDSSVDNAYAMALSADIHVGDTGKVTKEDNTIFFGCLSGGVGKAAAWGYPSHQRSLIEFEAAIRMVRADYCGTGNSFTVPGNPLDIQDTWNVNQFVNAASPTEAIWGKSGAKCVNTPRYDIKYPDALTIQNACVTLGATPPKVCQPADTIASYGAYYWSKNP